MPWHRLSSLTADLGAGDCTVMLDVALNKVFEARKRLLTDRTFETDWVS